MWNKPERGEGKRERPVSSKESPWYYGHQGPWKTTGAESLYKVLIFN